jgi:NADPH2:quinone reductase
MQAIRPKQTGGPEVLQLAEVPTPTPGPTEVLVRVEAAGLNFIDVYHRTGLYPLPLPLPIGLEGAGTVEQVGGAVNDRQGRRARRLGLRAGIVRHPRRGAGRAPGAGSRQRRHRRRVRPASARHDRALSDEDDFPAARRTPPSCTRPLAALDCCSFKWPNACRSAGHRHGFHRSQGGPGQGGGRRPRHQLPSQRLRRRNQAPDRRARRGRGLRFRRQGDLRRKPGCPRAARLPRAVRTVERRGAGAGSRPLGQGLVLLTRPSLPHYTATRAELLSRAGDLFEMVGAGQLRVRIGRTFPLAQAADAHRALDGRETTGKVLLIP